jgi:hypothetical protein
VIAIRLVRVGCAGTIVFLIREAIAVGVRIAVETISREPGGAGTSEAPRGIGATRVGITGV